MIEYLLIHIKIVSAQLCMIFWWMFNAKLTVIDWKRKTMILTALYGDKIHFNQCFSRVSLIIDKRMVKNYWLLAANVLPLTYKCI